MAAAAQRAHAARPAARAACLSLAAHLPARPTRPSALPLLHPPCRSRMSLAGGKVDIFFW